MSESIELTYRDIETFKMMYPETKDKTVNTGTYFSYDPNCKTIYEKTQDVLKREFGIKRERCKPPKRVTKIELSGEDKELLNQDLNNITEIDINNLLEKCNVVKPAEKKSDDDATAEKKCDDETILKLTKMYADKLANIQKRGGGQNQSSQKIISKIHSETRQTTKHKQKIRQMIALYLNTIIFICDNK